LCRKLLAKDETDICHQCRIDAPEFIRSKFQLSFVAGWTAVWYYKDNVRQSLLRYKFYGHRSYARAYGRLLAMKLHSLDMTDFDILTYIPVSKKRLRKRGFDQVQLLAQYTASELGVCSQPALEKIRHNKPQSRIQGEAHRRANVLGAYRVIDPTQVQGKRILLLDDIVTTGATASECARVLLTAGAKEIQFAVLATAAHQNKTSR
jgi:ComF family protein